MVRIDLQSVIPTAKPGLERYVEKVILWGGSAEATFAVQPEFVEPDGFIKAVIATYSGLAIEANREKSFVEAWIIPTRFSKPFGQDEAWQGCEVCGSSFEDGNCLFAGPAGENNTNIWPGR
jgi:hypothetical protein